MFANLLVVYKVVSGLIGLVKLVCRTAKAVVERATRILFMPVYQRSHEIWLKRHRPFSYWQECGSYLEYSVYLPHLANSEPRTPRIALRARNEEIASLIMVFEAESSRGYFPETINAFDVAQRQKIYMMANIPCQDYLCFGKTGGGTFAFDSYKIFIKQMTLKSGEEIRPHSSLTHHLTHGWLLQSTWYCKSTPNLNLDAIRWAKQRIADYWKFIFGMPAVRYYVPYPVRRKITFFSLIESLTRPAAWIMASKFAVSMQFWLATWSQIFVLNNDSELEFRWKRHPAEEIPALDA